MQPICDDRPKWGNFCYSIFSCSANQQEGHDFIRKS